MLTKTRTKWSSFSTLLISLFLSCNPGEQTRESEKDKTVQNPQQAVAEKRETVLKKAVLSYQKKTPNDLNNFFLTVNLYETEYTFVYRVTMQYEEIRGEDEISFPNLGSMPQPYIEAGPDAYSAVIGFTDNKGAKREYKKVIYENGNLKINTLKRYAAYTKPAG